MNIQTKIFLSLIMGGILLTAGDLFMKSWAMSSYKVQYIIGVFFWILGSAFLAWTYKYKNMAVATVFYIMINVITLILVSWVYYKEPLTIKQIIGVALAIISISLI